MSVMVGFTEVHPVKIVEPTVPRQVLFARVAQVPLAHQVGRVPPLLQFLGARSRSDNNNNKRGGRGGGNQRRGEALVIPRNLPLPLFLSLKKNPKGQQTGFDGQDAGCCLSHHDAVELKTQEMLQKQQHRGGTALQPYNGRMPWYTTDQNYTHESNMGYKRMDTPHCEYGRI
jgi:hypothetical protein